MIITVRPVERVRPYQHSQPASFLGDMVWQDGWKAHSAKVRYDEDYRNVDVLTHEFQTSGSCGFITIQITRDASGRAKETENV